MMIDESLIEDDTIQLMKSIDYYVLLVGLTCAPTFCVHCLLSEI